MTKKGMLNALDVSQRRKEMGVDPWEWACRLDLSRTLNGQRAALALTCFGTPRQPGGVQGVGGRAEG